MNSEKKMNLHALVWIIAVVGVSSCGVESAIFHLECEGDYHCPDGYYCVAVSHLCTKCSDCSVYKRKSSWRSCPKDPADCGTCLAGYEEEILAGGRTRDICVKSSVYSSEGSVGTSIMMGHYMLFLGMMLMLLPIMFYVYFHKHWRRGDNHLQTSSRVTACEDPPPYNSNLELRPLRSQPREEEMCVNETIHELNVQQKEEILVQAVPFRQPQFEQNLSFIPNEDDEIMRVESEYESEHEERPEPSLELEDESTMPSEWTPFQEEASTELVSTETEGSSEECEPRSERRRKEEDSDGSDNTNSQCPPINLIINNNNNITINKFN